MGKINRKALLISLLLTVACGILLFGYIRSLKVPAAETQKTSIPVAVRDIAIGEAVATVDIRMQEISSDSVPEGIITDKAEIEGKVASKGILTGEPFRQERLTTLDTLPLSYNLPTGYRAVSIFVNESNLLSMQVLPGDHVDLIASWTLKPKDGDEIQLTHTVLQNLEVLALGLNRVPNEKAGNPSTESNNVADPPKTITLAVTPEQAEKVVFNAQYSSFTLALRGQGDEEIAKTNGALIIDMVPDRLLPFALMPGESSKSGTESGSGSGSATTGGSGAAAAVP